MHLFCALCLAVAHALPGFGGGNGSILIDNAACTGDEERLDQCVHNGIGSHDCPLDHSYDAGVFCDPYSKGTVNHVVFSNHNKS